MFIIRKIHVIKKYFSQANIQQVVNTTLPRLDLPNNTISDDPEDEKKSHSHSRKWYFSENVLPYHWEALPSC